MVRDMEVIPEVLAEDSEVLAEDFPAGEVPRVAGEGYELRVASHRPQVASYKPQKAKGIETGLTFSKLVTRLESGSSTLDCAKEREENRASSLYDEHRYEHRQQ